MHVRFFSCFCHFCPFSKTSKRCPKFPMNPNNIGRSWRFAPHREKLQVNRILYSTIQKLIDLALEAKEKAYCPYSSFRVGCAVLCPDGSMFSGCNVENASYGLSVYAERVAVMKAVSEGHQKFKATAIACDVKGSFKASCGACRQVYSEFGLDLEMYLVKPDMTVKKVILGDIFSMAFTPDVLMEERI